MNIAMADDALLFVVSEKLMDVRFITVQRQENGPTTQNGKRCPRRGSQRNARTPDIYIAAVIMDCVT